MSVAVEYDGPNGTFFSGSHSISAEGMTVGIGQQVRQETALTVGILVVCDRDEPKNILKLVH